MIDYPVHIKPTRKDENKSQRHSLVCDLLGEVGLAGYELHRSQNNPPPNICAEYYEAQLESGFGLLDPKILRSCLI